MNTLRISFFCLSLAASQAFAYGAIAVGDKDAKAQDASSEVHFITSGHADTESAKDEALKQCKAKGLQFCHVASWFTQCGAYARSDTNTQSGTGAGATRDEASAAAETSCGVDCKTVVVHCETDKKT